MSIKTSYVRLKVEDLAKQRKSGQSKFNSFWKFNFAPKSNIADLIYGLERIKYLEMLCQSTRNEE